MSALALGSDVTSTTPFITCSAWAGIAFRACTTLRLAVRVDRPPAADDAVGLFPL